MPDSNLTLRSVKGESLSHNEMDANFRDLFYSASITGSTISLFKSSSGGTNPYTVVTYFDEVRSKPTLVSGSFQIITEDTSDWDNLSASISSDYILRDNYLSSSLAPRITAQELFSSSLDATFATDAELTTAISTLSSSANLRRNQIRNQISASTHANYLKNTTDTLNGDLTLSGNLNVNGTGSFAVIQSITGSAKIIGDAYIVLNNNTPAERYAGIQVYDSGSSNVTASLEFDGLNNDWFYSYNDGTVDHGIVLFGPEYSSKGSPTYPTAHTIQKGTGGHHLADSIITDSGSTVTINGDLDVTGTVNATITGSIDNAVTASYIDATNIDGTVTNASTASFVTFNDGLSTTSDVRFDSLGIGTPAPATTGEIVATGDITAYYSSDERLKDNITPLSNALDKINQIGGYEFDWNSDSSHSGHDVGVIAQEIEKVLPEVVVDRDTGYKAVRYDKIVALLINAIKEQQLQIDELKSKL